MKTAVCLQSPSESFTEDGSGDDCVSIGQLSTTPSVTSSDSTAFVSPSATLAV